jgi:hypothetical protein
MSAQPNQPLIPGGIKSELWALLSNAQQQVLISGTFPAADFKANTDDFDCSLIQDGGIPKGLNDIGTVLWNAIDADGTVGIEVINNASNTDSNKKSTFTDVVSYLNNQAIVNVINVKEVIPTITDIVSSISLDGEMPS